MTRRREILAMLRARLEGIRVAAGYETDAGLNVHHGEVEPTTDDAYPLIAMIPGETEVLEEADRAMIELPVELKGLAVADPDNPLDSVEPLLGDMKRAVFGTDRNLGGLAADVKYVTEGTIARPSGGRFSEAHLTLAIVYHELLGTPEH